MNIDVIIQIVRIQASGMIESTQPPGPFKKKKNAALHFYYNQIKLIFHTVLRPGPSLIPNNNRC